MRKLWEFRIRSFEMKTSLVVRMRIKSLEKKIWSIHLPFLSGDSSQSSTSSSVSHLPPNQSLNGLIDSSHAIPLLLHKYISSALKSPKNHLQPS
jgi:hypothetical protein